MIKRRATDWDCACGEINFGKRVKCRKCDADRPVKPPRYVPYLKQIIDHQNKEPQMPQLYPGTGGYTAEIDGAIVITPHTNYYDDPDHICEISPAVVAEITQPVIVRGFLYSHKCDSCRHKVALLREQNVTLQKCGLADHPVKKHPIYLGGYLV